MLKNLIAYRISPPLWPADLAAIEEALAKSPFIECGATQQKSAGWVPPRGEAHGALVESIGGQWIARLMTETKSVPGSVLARKVAKINGDEAMFAGLVHDLGVFYLMSRAANFPELVNDKAELHALLVGWHDNIGHALLSALGTPEAVLDAVQMHETDREIRQVKTLSDTLYIANKIANRTSSWRDPELDGMVDTSILDQLFDAGELAEIIEESEEDVQIGRASCRERVYVLV